MNAYEKATTLGLVGTDAEIVSQLQAVTLRPINLTYLMELLNFRGMLRKTDGQGGQERWQGTLQNLKAALVSLSLTDHITSYELWFSHVTNPRQVSWDTSQPQWATAFLAMENSFAGGDGMPSGEDFTAVVALGGGRPYASLTVESYGALRTAADAAVIAQAAADAQNSVVATVMNEHINPNVGDVASLITGLQSAIAYLESL